MYKGQLLVKVLIIFIALSFSKTFADSKLSDVNQKKAGVIYNLSKFIDWPDITLSREKFNICLTSKTVFLDAMKTFEKRKIRGLEVRIHVLKNITSNTLSVCQTLYINSSEQQLLSNILTLLNNKSILTVSDLSNFSLQGGMIELIQIKKRVQFAINLDAAKAVNLLISAQLLRLAKTVKYKNNQINNH
ncbi:MAG: YfiR family protein [Candidatus Marithrix sp.]|nr:YfiR family protein [Candidatus Marithrix sp.]